MLAMVSNSTRWVASILHSMLNGSSSPIKRARDLWKREEFVSGQITNRMTSTAPLTQPLWKTDDRQSPCWMTVLTSRLRAQFSLFDDPRFAQESLPVPRADSVKPTHVLQTIARNWVVTPGRKATSTTTVSGFGQFEAPHAGTFHPDADESQESVKS